MLETAKSVPKKWKYGNVTETFTFLVEILPSPTLRTFWAEPVQKVTLYLPACPHLYLHHLDQNGIYDMINISFKTPSIINIHALTSTTLIKTARQLLLSAQLNLCHRAIHDMTIYFASEKHFFGIETLIRRHCYGGIEMPRNTSQKNDVKINILIVQISFQSKSFHFFYIYLALIKKWWNKHSTRNPIVRMNLQIWAICDWKEWTVCETFRAVSQS